MFNQKDKASFFDAYIECALWSSTDQSNEQGGDSLDKNYSGSDIHTNSLRKMAKDCEDFIIQNETDLEEYCEQRSYDPSKGSVMSYAGHDFWLDRNGHGAGFWSRDVDDELGDRLSDSAQNFGEQDIYVGDDGKLYIT